MVLTKEYIKDTFISVSTAVVINLKAFILMPLIIPMAYQFDVDMFDVPKENCTTDAWHEQIDSWDIVGHNLDGADCGAYYDNFRCLCRAYFSLGAILGAPHYSCEPCD